MSTKRKINYSKKNKIKKEKMDDIKIPFLFFLSRWRINLITAKKNNFSILNLRKHFNYIAIFFLIVSFFGLVFMLYKYTGVFAATYNFNQNNWQGGADIENFPFHPDNQTSWDRYYEKDEGIEANENIQLKKIEGYWEQKTEEEFERGEFNSTKIDEEKGSIILD